MTIVVDPSLVVAALIDSGSQGQWAESLLISAPLAARHLMPVETANILRRSALAGDISADVASLAHEDLLSLPVTLFGYQVCSARAWELRSTVTSYGATYVALAEMLGVRLATLDIRLSHASGTRCEFLCYRPDSPVPR